MSLCALVGLNANLTAPLIIPLLKPAGEKKGSATVSVLAASPAMSPFNGTNLYTSLYLSYAYLYPLSKTAYEDDLTLSKKSLTFCICVFEFVTLTTSALCGEANTIASFLSSAIVIKLST